MKKVIILFVLFALCFNSKIIAHAINFETERHAPAVTVKAFFSRSAPLVNARVEIYAPESEQPFQTGRTDQKGIFAFVPTVTGNWRIRVDDERGHAGNVSVSISGNFFEAGEAGETEETEETGEITDPAAEAENAAVYREEEAETTILRDIPLAYRIIFGLSLIFGITAIIYASRVRQELNSRNREA